MSLNDLSFERKKSSVSDWKSRLASKFKGNKDYEVIGNGGEDGVNIESYKKTSDEFGDQLLTAPRTEPIKRRPIPNNNVAGTHRVAKDDPNKQQISLTSSSKRPTLANSSRGSRTTPESGRKVRQNIFPGFFLSIFKLDFSECT